MEGFFSIKSYCELTGISSDTAYHRINRNEVKSIKGPDGRHFIYFSDEKIQVPENFVTIEEYAEKECTTVHAIVQRIRSGRYKDEDIFKANKCFCNGRMQKAVYINKFAITKPKGYLNARDYSPKDYLSVIDWANREGISKPYAYYLVRSNKIPGLFKNGFIYVSKEAKYVRQPRGRKNDNRKEKTA